jgi:hypothetical protein
MPISKTIDEQKAFCNTWKQSKLSKISFCKQNNISKSALYTWLKKFSKNDETSETSNKNIQPTSVKFLRVNNVNPDSCSCSKNSALEIIMPNGIIIKTNPPQNSFNIFLQELLKWK